MKKFLLNFALGALAIGISNGASASTVYCTQTGGYYPGIYTFSTEGSAPEQLWQSNALTSAYGSVFTADAVYMTFKETYQRYCTRAVHNGDFQDWSTTRINGSLKVTDVPVALGWNDITGNIYGCFIDNADQTSFSWGVFSEAEGTATVISSLEKQLVSIAASPTGALYAIDVDGTLFSATTDGKLTEIGSTGVVPSPKYCAGLAFDPDSEILYWTPTTKGMDTFLYTIDLTTGEATQVYQFSDNTRLTSLYIPESEAPEGAPADVEDFLALPDGFQDKLDITFTLPTKTQGGEDMLGAVKYKVMVDQEVIADTQGGPGQEVELSVIPGEGKHVVALFISNNAGKANRAIATVYVGADSPGAVTDLKISSDGKTITLSWDAPVAGLNGGNFDKDALRYEVVRVNDNEVVASDLEETTFTETVDPESLEKFSYTVTPKCGELSGPAITSPSVLIGDGMKPPYEQSFDSAESFDEIYFSTYDANNDGYGWTFYQNYYGTAGNARYKYSSTNDADDWLFTCPLSLEAGYKYLLSFNLSCGSWGNGERLGVSYGTLPEVEAMTEVALPDTDYAKGFNGSVEASIEPETSGTYYVGIHITSGKDSYDVNLDNIKIDAGVETAVKELTASLTATRLIEGGIEVVLQNPANVKVFGINGNTVADFRFPAGSHKLSLASGIYVVSINGTPLKVNVK